MYVCMYMYIYACIYMCVYVYTYVPGRMIVQRLIVQKRPTIEAKETYYRGKRDLQCRGRSCCVRQLSTAFI